MEYESGTQRVLCFIEPELQNVKQLQHTRLSWHIRYPNRIHGNTHNNLESHCI
jgi:hypothetical protein